MKITAKADLTPVRQRTQYTCMATSTMMALKALGHQCTEDQVNEVMGAQPMRGASWEQALACIQHYGCRGTLVCPSTVTQLKEWTDAGKPVLIAWNPEGREWSHASVVFDVTEDPEHGLMVHVADPNIPDPEETVRLVPKKEFYQKWYEKWPNYLVRRPALMIDREITSDGNQVMASHKKQDLPMQKVAMNSGSVEAFIFLANSKLTQYDQKLSVTQPNPYRLGHYLEALSKVKKSVTKILHESTPEALATLKKAFAKEFMPDLAPIKNVNKQMDAFLATGKLPDLTRRAALQQAVSLPKGSPERRKILAQLKTAFDEGALEEVHDLIFDASEQLKDAYMLLTARGHDGSLADTHSGADRAAKALQHMSTDLGRILGDLKT